MAYIMGLRMQNRCLPLIIDDYVGPDDPVRVYDAFVDTLDLPSLGILIESKPGPDEYHPAVLLKLLIYGYSYGIRSSRKLERACCHNLSFQWLTGGLQPDYRTIARFRIRYKEQIKQILKQCVRICVDLELIEGNVLFTDGSKFRANASINNTRTQEKCERALERLDKTIDSLLEECEHIDQEEEGTASLVKLRKKIADKEQLSQKIRKSLQVLQETKATSHNSTDEESIKAKNRQGIHASYNVQINVDGQNGLIVHGEAISDCNDYNHLKEQVDKSSQTLGHHPEYVCADSRYSSIKDLKEIPADIQVIVPDQEVLVKERTDTNDKSSKNDFTYDQASDEYICPIGTRLKLSTISNKRDSKVYRAYGPTCRSCLHLGICTINKSGRGVERSFYEEIQQRIIANYKSTRGQQIYKLRKEKVEHVYGHMKRNLGAGQFMLRGRDKVNAEVSLLSTCFNIARMITIVGIPQLLMKLTG